MAKDYFEDITPPEEGEPRKIPLRSMSEQDDDPQAEGNDEMSAPKGIRSISASARNRARMPIDGRGAPASASTRPKSGKRWILWAVASIAVVVVAGLALLAFRSTTVTVIPKSHTVVFGETSQFVAYPAETAATGTLAYTMQTLDMEDSEVVQAQGTTTIPPSKASGSITVYNMYSAAPVRLIKNTRFETPDGLVFRVPTDIVVPGKKGNTPGQIDVTVASDGSGEKYNVGPVPRFTLPGLKSSPDMFANVYGRSSQTMTGGSSGG